MYKSLMQESKLRCSRRFFGRVCTWYFQLQGWESSSCTSHLCKSASCVVRVVSLGVSAPGTSNCRVEKVPLVQVTYAGVQVALFVAFLWACLHLILPTAGLGKFRLYEKGYYCALDLTPEKNQDRVLVYLVITEGILSTAALLYSCVVIINSLVKRRRRVSEQLSVQHRGGGLRQVKRQHGGFAGLTLTLALA